MNENDIISRQEAIDALIDRFADEDSPCIEYMVYWDHGMVIDTLKHVPTAQPKKGKWILIRPDEDKAGNGLYECSECGKGDIHAPEVEVPFCWNCGAYMRGGEDG